MVLRVSRIATPVPATASTYRRVSVATPDSLPRKFSAVRSPVRIARSEPLTTATTVVRSTRVPSSTSASTCISGSSARNTASSRVDPADDAGLLREELRGPRRVQLHGRLGRDVTFADVLGERVQDEPLDGGGRYSHVSSAGG